MMHSRTISFSVAAALVLLLPPLSGGAAAPTPTPRRAISLPGCDTTCGNLSVSYPFGMGSARCYWPGFNLTCDRRSNPPRLMLGNDGTFQVVQDIDPELTMVAVVRHGAIEIDGDGNGVFGGGLEHGGPYALSSSNELILTGCNVRGTLKHGDIIMGGCSSFCESGDIDESGFIGFVPSR
jgi:hypothetical protein